MTKKNKRVNGLVTLKPQDVQSFRVQAFAIEQQRMFLKALESTLFTSISTKYGVDLEKEHWELDLEGGVIRRVATE